MNKILLVENNKEISEIIQFYLKDEYKTSSVQSAEDALMLVEHTLFDVILLDILLPGIDGIEFCSQIRQKVYCPIIFISCLGEDNTIVKALNMGGDDYIVKPFKGPLLRARIEANLRRSRVFRDEILIQANDLILNQNTHTVKKGDENILLSPTEYEILYYMMKNRGRLITFDDLYTAVWNQSSIGDVRTVFVHIYNLRRKIETDPTKPEFIITQRHDGYIFSATN
ncbi:MAG: DNA-binding response regulator [Chloroflexi bacterium HGW-Chloroflexi-10]|nr:MAG: DNA-binding response regulator [Chloroflexi bacterium HGW-Chloroflexi-10]